MDGWLSCCWRSSRSTRCAPLRLWVAGGLLFRVLDERHAAEEPDGGWPGVTVLIPAYNEEAVIATSVAAALAVDYPELEVLVLDDGSTDATEAAALEARAGDPRCRVIRDPVNRGKADRLNVGFSQARHELVAVTDADTHMHPAGAQAARRSHGSVAAPGRGRRGAARHQPRPPAPRDAGAGGGVDHRPDPPHPVPDRTRRRRRRRPRPLPPRPCPRRRRLRPADGDRGHRPELEAAAPRLAHGVRAARARRHAGSGVDPRAVDAAQALGPRPGRGAARPLRRGEPLAQPPHVAARLRRRSRPCVWVVALALSLVFAVLGILVGRGRERVRVRAGVGRRDRARGHHPDDRRAHPRARLRPQHLPTAPRRRALPARVLGDLRQAALHSEIVSLLRGPRDRRVVWNIPREPLARQPEKASRRDG